MYDTGTILSPQKTRRQVHDVWYWESDPAVGFQIEDVATTDGNHSQGTNWDLFVANGYQYGLKNVFTCKNPSHATEADRYCVPSTFFNTTNFANQGAALIAFFDNFIGLNMTCPPKNKRARVPVARKVDAEFACVAAEYLPGDLLTPVWDADFEWVHPFKWQKTADTGLAIARVVEAAPMLPMSGNVTSVMATIDVAHIPT